MPCGTVGRRRRGWGAGHPVGAASLPSVPVEGPEAVPSQHRLGLTAASTTYTDGSGRVSREVAVSFEDWTIDGTPLRTLLGWARPPQEMTPLSSEGFWSTVAVRHLRELLGELPGEFNDGRVAMLRCPIDGDLGCSALSMRLVLLDEAVIWRDFGWQNNYEPYAPEDDASELRFTFDRRTYESFLHQTLGRYAP